MRPGSIGPSSGNPKTPWRVISGLLLCLVLTSAADLAVRFLPGLAAQPGPRPAWMMLTARPHAVLAAGLALVCVGILTRKMQRVPRLPWALQGRWHALQFGMVAAATLKWLPIGKHWMSGARADDLRWPLIGAAVVSLIAGLCWFASWLRSLERGPLTLLIAAGALFLVGGILVDGLAERAWYALGAKHALVSILNAAEELAESVAWCLLVLFSLHPSTLPPITGQRAVARPTPASSPSG